MPSSVGKIEKPFNLRLKSDLKAVLANLALKNNESLNSHIVTRLRDSLFLEGAGIEGSIKLLHEISEVAINKDRPTTPTALRLERLLHDYNLIHSNQINQAHLAYVLGYEHASSVERFFSGKTTPSFSELKQFSDFFNCGESWLATGLGAPYPPKMDEINEDSVSPFVIGLMSTPDTTKKIKSIIFVASPALSDVALIVRGFSDESMQVYTLPVFNAPQKERIFNATMLNVAYYVFRKSLFKYSTLALAVSVDDFEKLLMGQDHPSRILHGYIEACRSGEGSQGMSDIKHPLTDLYRITGGFSEYETTSLDSYFDESLTKNLLAVSIINASPNLVFDK